MSLTLKVNFKKGWPSPSIVEKAAQPATGVTTLEAGMVGHLDTAGAWVLGVSHLNQLPYVFRNDQGDPDANRGAHDATYVAGAFGAIQGVAHSNPIEYQTVQYAGTPAVGDELYADTDGEVKVAVTKAQAEARSGTTAASQVIVAVVTKGVHAYQHASYIQVVPDNSRRLSPAS